MSRTQALTLALVVSVAINLLGAGMLIGRFSRPGGPPEPPMSWAAGPMSAELQGRVREQMRERLPEARPLREELRRAMAAVRSAVVAETLDEAALRSAMARLRQAQDAYRGFMQESLLEIAAELPREQRIALLRRALEQGVPGGRPHRAGQDQRQPR